MKPSRRGRSQKITQEPPARASKKRKSQPSQTPVSASGGSTKEDEKSPKKASKESKRSKKTRESEEANAAPKPKTTRKRKMDQGECDKNPAKKTRSAKSSKSSDMPEPPLPAQPGPEQHEEHDEVPPPEPSTRGKGKKNSQGAKPAKETKAAPRRKVATPQQRSTPPPSYDTQVMEDLLPVFKGELAHQWKSGRTNLKLEDFETVAFERITMSNYFSRSRPAIGLKIRKNINPGSVHKTGPLNTEWAHFSFSLKDVCNVGLAWKCATHTVLSNMNWCFVFCVCPSSIPKRMILYFFHLPPISSTHVRSPASLPAC